MQWHNLSISFDTTVRKHFDTDYQYVHLVEWSNFAPINVWSPMYTGPSDIHPLIRALILLYYNQLQNCCQL